MISWIQNHLIRHGRWIFITLLTVIIVAFVFTIGNTPGCTTDRSGYEENYFYGHDLNSSYEMEALSEKVSLSAILKTGRPLQNQQQFQAQLMNRVALLHLADEMDIPAPSESSLATYIQSQAAFRGPDGQFSRDAYTRFVDNIETDPNMRQEIIILVLEEDYRISQVEKAISGPGYFLPSEALSQVQRNETELELVIAEIDYNEFSPEIATEEAGLKQFYEENIQRYQIQERIQASYIKFPTEKYESSVDLSEEQLREHFITNRARFVSAYNEANPVVEDANEEELSPPPVVTFEDVRIDVVEDLEAQTAQKLANQAAQDFVLSLYRNSIQLASPEFQEQLDANTLELVEITPYTEEEASGRGLSAEMLKSAFTLSKDRYFSDAYKVDDGYGVLIFSDRLPPETPEYEAVSETVESDYKAEEKRRLFNEEGIRLKSELAALLDAEVGFAQASETLGMKVTEVEKFKVSEAPRTINATALQHAKNMNEAELSSMLTSGDTGLFVYVVSKTVPTIEVDDEKLTQANDFLQRYGAYISSSMRINELITNGLPPEDLSE